MNFKLLDLNIANLKSLNFDNFGSKINDFFIASSQLALQIALIIVLTYIALKIREIAINKAFNIVHHNDRKQQTLATLLMSITRYVIIAISTVMILESFGVKVGPILAGAGIVGIAVGFGAQDMVKDFIRGFFIMFEDQFHVGDYVQINETIIGTVESLGLRSTTIKEWNGTLIYISNSSITLVKNYNRSNMRSIVSILVAYEENYEKVVKVINEFCEKFTQEYSEHFIQDSEGNFIEPPQFHGIDDIIENQIGAKYTIKCLVADSSFFLINKELRSGLLQAFRENNIMLAYPKTIYGTIPTNE